MVTFPLLRVAVRTTLFYSSEPILRELGDPLDPAGKCPTCSASLLNSSCKLSEAVVEQMYSSHIQPYLFRSRHSFCLSLGPSPGSSISLLREGNLVAKRVREIGESGLLISYLDVDL